MLCECVRLAGLGAEVARDAVWTAASMEFRFQRSMSEWEHLARLGAEVAGDDVRAGGAFFPDLPCLGIPEAQVDAVDLHLRQPHLGHAPPQGHISHLWSRR